MAVHQYIGARYVPYYYENSLDPTSTEWEPNVNYEALTVVTLPNQHSYISKKAVPDTVGTPAANPEYWLDTGSDNAYIEQLREDMGNLADLDTTDKTSIVNAINEVLASGQKTKAAFFGNSFTSGFGGVTGIYEEIKDLYDDSVLYSEGGAGFMAYGNNGNKSFNHEISAADPDDDVTDVVIIGAVGEPYSMQDYSTDDWITAMKTSVSNFYNAAVALYPNCKRYTYIYAGAVEQMHRTSTLTPSGYMDYQAEFWTHLLMKDILSETGIRYGGWAGWDIMFDTSCFLTGGHPSQKGCDILSKNCKDILTGIGIHYQQKQFFNTVNATPFTGATPVSVNVKQLVTPEETIQAQISVGSAASHTWSGTDTFVYIDTTDLDFFSPMGYYDTAGGHMALQKDANVLAQFREPNSWITERYTVDMTTRNPVWGRVALSGSELISRGLSRLPQQYVITHNPLFRGSSI